MGTIIIHAGRPKAGSTTVQRWIAEQAAALRERDVAVLVAKRDPDKPAKRFTLRDYESRGLNSGIVVRRYVGSGREPGILERFVSQLDASASNHETVVVSSEAFASLFVDADPALLDPLEQLARSHHVRVAYYVRPQHSAFEAMWRQYGFREEVEPVDYFERCRAQHDYWATLQAVRSRAPGVSFEVRPFRNDLLVGRHVATDFASTFLSAADLFSWIPTTWENRGLPLALTNALRFAPRGLFWEHAHDNATLRRLQQLFGGVEPRADGRTRRSRSILRAHCRSVFGPGNARLVSELGWATESFVAPVGDELVEPWDLRELDELWRPVASSGELDLLFRALETLVADGSPVAAHT